VANLRFKVFVFNHEHGRVKSIAKIPKSVSRRPTAARLSVCFYHRHIRNFFKRFFQKKL